MLFEAPGNFAVSVQRRIWHMAESLAAWPGVVEAVPGVTNLMLVYGEPTADLVTATKLLMDAWTQSAPAPVSEGRCVEISVTYGGRYGVDLAAVADYAGLDVAEIVRRHSDAEYRVFAIGSQPGFAYLGGLDPAIACPRKPVPVLRVAAGAVVIGGLQTGIVASTGPNGWHTIGYTEALLFDPAARPPTLLTSGDRVRFRKLATLA